MTESPSERVNWHETDELPNGTPIGKLGSKWYLLDDDGRAVSKGFHEYNDDGTRGKIGALWYLLDDDGQPISKGYHEINAKGTRGKLGARTEPIKSSRGLDDDPEASNAPYQSARGDRSANQMWLFVLIGSVVLIPIVDAVLGIFVLGIPDPVWYSIGIVVVVMVVIPSVCRIVAWHLIDVTPDSGADVPSESDDPPLPGDAARERYVTGEIDELELEHELEVALEGEIE